MNPTTGTGDYKIGELVYQGYSSINSTASAKVTGWSNNKLSLVNIDGNFVSSQPVYGQSTNTNYKFTSYNVVPSQRVEINIVPDPLNANAASPWTANTTITESN